MDRCGIVVGRCGSLWVVPGFSNYDSKHYITRVKISYKSWVLSAQ